MKKGKLKLKELMKKVSSLIGYLGIVIVLILIIGLVSLKLAGISKPLFVVDSPSMEHEGNDFDAWWSKTITINNPGLAENMRFVGQEDFFQRIDISKEDFKSFMFSNGINIGDVLIVGPPKNIKKGDVISYNMKMRDSDNTKIYTHRVYNIETRNKTTYYYTKGDANLVIDFGTGLPQEKVISKTLYRIPLIGKPFLFLLRE